MHTARQMIYRQVTEVEPAVTAFFKKHVDRLVGGELPQGLWVCEEDGELCMALLVYTKPHVRVSVIIDKPETKPFVSLARLAKTYEGWATSRGIGSYAVVVPEAGDDYCKIIEKRGGVEIGRGGGWVEYLHQIKQTVDTTDGIRPWMPVDWQSLRPLMRAFLTEHYALGGDFPATRHNIEAFVRKGVKAAHAGDPALLAYEAGTLVGFCLWTGVVTGGLDVRERICAGIGTYVVPERRRQGWSKRIRERALEVAQAAGYDRVDGVALEKRGYDAGVAAGFAAAGVLVRKQLDAQELRKVG